MASKSGTPHRPDNAKLASSTQEPVTVTDSSPATAPENGAKVAPNLHEETHPATVGGALTGDTAQSQPSPKSRRVRKIAIVAVAATAIVGAGWVWPSVRTALDTVSTDDAYVNGHVTFVAPRVAGQVAKVLVDDNNRVNKGDILVELDPEPFRIEVEIKQAAVAAAKAELAGANAQVRALVGRTRSQRYALEFAIEQVDDQVAKLQESVAALASRQAELELAQSNLRRGEELSPTGGISKEDLDIRRQTVKVDEANVAQAQQVIYAQRASLGLPLIPPEGQALDGVPPNLNQNFSAVREALGALIESAAGLGYSPPTFDPTPDQAIADFKKQDPSGNLDRIYTNLIANAPQIQEAQAQLKKAESDLDQAELNLRYCTVVSEIDGVVTRRNVNPGNNVQAGQSVMAVRSLTEIWVDANFKETQLAELRIGQRAECEVDMYGSKHVFEGRITGFTMGTGETLSLLPPQNATGNFVKIVQRLPVRIELTDYDPNQLPLIAGLSVEPRVFYKESPTGPRAGEYLQLSLRLPQLTADSTP